VPIAIVRSAPAVVDGRERIVVGVDGSATSLRALAWATEEARLRGATLVVVHAWRPVVMPALAPLPPYIDPESLRLAAEELVAAALATVPVAELAHEVETLVVPDSPARAVLEAAADASLIVVGSRGRGGFTGLLLGSVSQHLIHHAECPVVVVPPGRDAAGAERDGS
jgi:nucleotide-binding universal stress UspA family protein